MPTVHETVYPRLKSAPTRRDLVDLYTPTEGELQLAERSSKGEPARLAFLVLLKTFQRLGYFVALRDLPRGIVEHIGHDRGMLIVPEAAEYDDSGTRRPGYGQRLLAETAVTAGLPRGCKDEPSTTA